MKNLLIIIVQFFFRFVLAIYTFFSGVIITELNSFRGILRINLVTLIKKYTFTLFYALYSYILKKPLKVAFIGFSIIFLIFGFVNIKLHNQAFHNLVFNNKSQALDPSNSLKLLYALLNSKSITHFKNIVFFKNNEHHLTIKVNNQKDLALILSKYRVNYKDIKKTMSLIKSQNKEVMLKNRSNNMEVSLITVNNNLTQGGPKLLQLELPLPNDYNLILKNNSEYSAGKQFKIYKKKSKSKSETFLTKQIFTIKNNYYNSAHKLGIPNSIIYTVSNILSSSSIPYRYKTNPNSVLEVLFQYKKVGNKVNRAKLLFASVTNQNNETMKFYRYNNKYYTSFGDNTQPFISTYPLDGYHRITSRFGQRVDPILERTLIHKGVDFAAPRGTPVPAAANGIIIRKIHSKSFGNYIEIQHNPYLQSIYAHMSNFHKGMRVGSHVRKGQIIGYVGSTGWSTGPHLHFEVHFNHKAVNPLNLAMPPRSSLKNNKLKSFLSREQQINMIMLNTPLGNKSLNMNKVNNYSNYASLFKKKNISISQLIKYFY